jgi:hypothetical protein
MFLILRKKAQSTAEYAILIGLVVAAITAMQIFIRAGLQKQVKLAVDDLGNTGIDRGAPDMNFGLTAANSTTNQNITDKESLVTGGGVTRNTNGNVSSNRNETVAW